MKLIETYEYNNEGYLKLFSYKEWRIAMLNYIDELDINNINHVEAHQETDEVFVLLEGKCQMILYCSEKKEFELINLEKNKIYNIPSGVYHNHTLSNDAKVLIVEQENTDSSNSIRKYFTTEEKQKLYEIWRIKNEV